MILYLSSDSIQLNRTAFKASLLLRQNQWQFSCHQICYTFSSHVWQVIGSTYHKLKIPQMSARSGSQLSTPPKHIGQTFCKDKKSGMKALPNITPDRRQEKTSRLSTNADQKSLEIAFSIVICRPTCGK